MATQQSNRLSADCWTRAMPMNECMLSSPGISVRNPFVGSGETPGQRPGPITAWEQDAYRLSYADMLDSCFEYCNIPGSGAVQSHVAPVVTVEKVTETEQEQDELPSYPRIIATIRSAMSLQVKELAEVLHVERPTIYAWIKQESSPQKGNRDQLHRLYRLADQWNELSVAPVGDRIRRAGAGGRSLLELLVDRTIQDEVIISQMRELSAELRIIRRPEIAANRSIESVARKHGIPIARIRRPDNDMDVLTGKPLNVD